MEAGWDFLNIHDGAGTWATGLGSFHGTSIPPTVTGSGEAITVRLTTDFSITAPGFQASFTCVDASGGGSGSGANPCVGSGVSLEDSGDVSLSGGYNNGHDCLWVLTCSNAALAPRERSSVVQPLARSS